MILKNSRILVVAAHPDDDVLGCGGTLAKAISKNAKVKILFLGEGVSSRFEPGEKYKLKINKAQKVRNKECIKSLNILGIKNYVFENRLCTRFDELPLLNLVKSIEKIILEFKPTIVFTHNKSEVNIDHKLTYDAVEVATRPSKKSSIKEIYSFEIACSGNFTFEKKFSPTTYVDISNFFKKKINSIKQYKNENIKFPHPRSLVGVEILAKYRGMQSHCNYSEAFKLEREIA